MPSPPVVSSLSADSNLPNPDQRRHVRVLIFSTFIAGICSIVYELLIATTGAYFLGDSIKQFSLVIGFYMANMGLGSYLSRLVNDEYLLPIFIKAEIILGLIGGLSVPFLYLSYAYFDYFQVVILLLTSLVGLLIGLEIPLLSRLMSPYFAFKDNLSNVLSVDYLGALIATLLFPFLLLPFMGIFRTSLFFGLINMSIGFAILWFFTDTLQQRRRKTLAVYNALAITILIVTFVLSKGLLKLWTSEMYTDRVVYAKETPYQQIVLTKDAQDIRLFLNGNLQFSSLDEYRYHEALVHVPMLTCQCQHILLLGGGDGLAVRELVKHDIRSMTLIDLDPAVTELAATHPYLDQLNQSAFADPRLTVINQDAFVYLSQQTKTYDLIIIDLPDPGNTALARFYSREFYMLAKSRLNPFGRVVTQATSPLYAGQAFWSIVETIRSAKFTEVVPYHVNIPSFGEWGFVMAGQSTLTQTEQLPPDTRFIDYQAIEKMLYFEKDLRLDMPVKVSTLDAPVVLDYYLSGWRTWN